MNVDFPRKLAFLFTPARYKSARGGRDGGKSWGYAQALVEIASAREAQLKEWGLWCDGPEFIVCARENMNSIADSVHRLLADTIERLALGHQFIVEKSRIANRFTSAEFVFKGVRHNPDAIKSLEGATRAWIEEAQSVSDDSWRKIIPTVRRPNSEIWLSWNPELESDPTYQRFVVHPPPGLVEAQLNFSDNPWSSEVLRDEREQMEADDPDEYAHVWLGQPRRMTRGSIYGNQMRLIEEQGRITSVPYNPSIPVHTGWDLGKRDFTAI